MKIELFDISHILHNNSTMQWDDGQKRLAQKMLSLWYYLNNNKEIYGEMGIHRQRDTSNEASETVKNPDNAQQRIRMR
jgi:predicted porin